MKAHAALIYGVFLALCPVAASADYQAGLDAYGSGDYGRAFYEWMKVAESPDGDVHPEILAETYYALGMLFWVGQGVQQSTAESALWLRKAAELNHPGAQVKLGFLYSSGEGVPQSDFEAMKWLMMAARQGDADAQYNLGVLYRDGLGVEPDAEKSLQWFREAASNGDAISAGIVQSAASESRARPPAPVPTKQGKPEPGSTAGEDWIRGRDPERYTIQVIALLDLEKLRAFVGRHPDWAPFALYEQEWKGKPLWVLVQGDYPDVIQAREAARKFPGDIQKRDKLWIRKFVMVQGLLK